MVNGLNSSVDEIISIVIPVYNAESYLSQCLDSILGQTYQAIEVICVNDASSDSSLQILNHYAKTDNRIKVYTKENEGVSRARNFGIKKTTGNYVMFVDADDWIEPNTCKRAFEEMQKNGFDVVMWAYVSEFEDHSHPKYVYPEYTIFDQTQVKEKIHRRFIGIIGDELAYPEKADSLCSVWCKLYRKKMITDYSIQFVDLNEIGTYEDGLFNFQVFQHVQSAAYIPECMYHYRRTNSSSQTSKYRERLPIQWNYLFSLMNSLIEENCLGQNYKEALNNRIALSVLGLGLNIMFSDYPVHVKQKMIKEVITSEWYQKASAQLKMHYLPIHWKLFYGFAAHRCSVGVFCLLLYIRKAIYG